MSADGWPGREVRRGDGGRGERRGKEKRGWYRLGRKMEGKREIEKKGKGREKG